MASDKFSQYRIINGPSKFHLMVSNFHGDSQNRQAVSFHLDEHGPGITLEVIINGNDREDGSGENWLLRGYIVSGVNLGPRFEAFFSVKNRKGWIKIYKD